MAQPEGTTATPLDRALADILVAAYKGKRMNQAALVEKSGIKTATMQRLLAGKARFSVDQLFELAKAIGGKSAAEYYAEAEAAVRDETDAMSVGRATVTPISSKKGSKWQGEDYAIEELDAVAKSSDSVIEINPDDHTP